MTSRARQGSRLVTAYDTGGLGMRNRIINGDMRIDQRNNGASVTFDTNASYILDRWTQNNGGGATITGQRSVTAPAGFVNSLLVTATSGGAPSAAQLRVVRQKIEGLNTSDLGWGTASAQSVTASFWVRSNVTGTFACYVTNAGYTRSQVQTFSISASNTWEYKTVVFAGDTSGTWATDVSTGIEFGFDVGSGSNFDATAGVWNAAFDTRTSGAVTLSSTTNNNMYITGVQLEAGSVATPFERRPYGTELALCQRYLPVTESASGGSGPIAILQWINSTFFQGQYFFQVQPRVPPTGMSVSSAGHFLANNPGIANPVVTGLTFGGGTRMGGDFTGTVAGSGGSIGASGYLRANSTSAQIQFTGCEL